MTNDEPEALAEEGLDPWDLAADVLREEAEVPVRIYDLEERTAKFGEAVIDLCALIPLGPRTNRLIDQLTGCGTSIGGNYGESDDALSERDFAKTIGICRKEARESKHFIRMMARACPAHKAALRRLWLEAHELHLIFSKIWRTARRNLDKPKR
jgi:four helix bundle protein